MKKVVKDNQESAHTNHYNKVVINRPKEEQYTNDTLYKLSIELSAINEDSNISSSSSYTQEISKEIAVRSNEMRIIVVKEGDTLSKIAKRAYGNYDDYVKIFDANPEIIKNPNEIYVGQKLRIPL
ncbi:MAG: LysM peptidoglycan-binding domain-containing protein [Epsilonproteobacteria bacterium]|nr:LysM peptidoglycan-binding domain-containing protein [Campylobacterota bacterium]